MRLSGHGIATELPRGWEGALLTASALDLGQSQFYSLSNDTSGRDIAEAPGVRVSTRVEALPVMHLANFALPPDRGDFGSGAVETMTSDDVFVALLEYGSEHAQTGLFDRSGAPDGLVADDFGKDSLQRILPGQVGRQEFFTASGRPFCLYVVLGGSGRAPHIRRLCDEANRVIARLEIRERT